MGRIVSVRMRYSCVLAMTFIAFAGPATAQSAAQTMLNELHAAPKPQQQDDLDTLKLASAHREQARSADEKTNGLFQSWVVSICEGCGVDLKPAKELKAKDFPVREPSTTGSVEPAVKAEAPRQDVLPEPPRQRHTGAAADLSPEGGDAIRRMPRR